MLNWDTRINKGLKAYRSTFSSFADLVLINPKVLSKISFLLFSSFIIFFAPSSRPSGVTIVISSILYHLNSPPIVRLFKNIHKLCWDFEFSKFICITRHFRRQLQRLLTYSPLFSTILLHMLNGLCNSFELLGKFLRSKALLFQLPCRFYLFQIPSSTSSQFFFRSYQIEYQAFSFPLISSLLLYLP